jgi:hypothetical protein
MAGNTQTGDTSPSWISQWDVRESLRRDNVDVPVQIIFDWSQDERALAMEHPEALESCHNEEEYQTALRYLKQHPLAPKGQLPIQF